MENKHHTQNIRNFSIIAHVDHGKSTLSDRILEVTGVMNMRNYKDRYLDTLELEQERGITIKLQTARMQYTYKGKDTSMQKLNPFLLNLVDTPGHVDFSYEVSRSLAASEGAILLIDAGQGIQAQTFTTLYKALEKNLTIIPVINKIDLPNIDIDKLISTIVKTFGFEKKDIILTSGKSGQGVDELLDAVVEKIPPPINNISNSARALIYDSFYNEHKGVVTLVKVVDGKFTKGDKLHMFGSNIDIEPIEIGYLEPELAPNDVISSGEIGYIATGIKHIQDVHVGDTVVKAGEFEHNPNILALPGYSPPKSMVFASMYPINSDDFDEFKQALEKLALNDAALKYQPVHSSALGTGFLCGFLGLLHMEITQERLQREFDIDLITTTPSVEYRLKINSKNYLRNQQNDIDPNGNLIIHSAFEFPDPTIIDQSLEPWTKLEIITPEKYIGPIMELAQVNRGVYKTMEYIEDDYFINNRHVILRYEIPLAEIIINFFDKLKSISQGYASMDYEFCDFLPAGILKVSIYINYEIVEALSFLAHASNAEAKGRALVEKLSKLIPRQQIPIPVQAAIGSKIFARETIKQYRKNVLAKMSGGDVTRKMKLLEKQKKGKKKAKEKFIGKIKVPQEVFLNALKID